MATNADGCRESLIGLYPLSQHTVFAMQMEPDGYRMREISPFTNMSVDEFLHRRLAPEALALIGRIRSQKANGSRPRPSTTLIDSSKLLTCPERAKLLDRVASLVDECLFGRQDMCKQFADLLSRALGHLGLPAKPVVGIAKYYVDGVEAWQWEHAWVRIGHEVVDGNVDSLDENLVVPQEVDISPYWGPISETPGDRKLRQRKDLSFPKDTDVDEIWWPELCCWLDGDYKTGHT